MERKDHKRIINQDHDASFNPPGHSTLDLSTTELLGTRRDADLIVRGLKALRAQVELREAAGIASQDDMTWGDKSLGAAPNAQELDILIDSIKVPKPISKPEITTQHE